MKVSLKTDKYAHVSERRIVHLQMLTEVVCIGVTIFYNVVRYRLTWVTSQFVKIRRSKSR